MYVNLGHKQGVIAGLWKKGPLFDPPTFLRLGDPSGSDAGGELSV